MIRQHPFLSISLACLVAVSSLLFSGCNLLPAEEDELAPPLVKPASIEYKTDAVERGTLIQQLRMSGTFMAESQRSLSFEKQGGRLKAIHVKSGQDVKAGDLIAELDAESLEYDISIQEIELQKSQLALDQQKANGADQYSIKRAQLDLKQAALRLEDMQKQLAATRILSPIDGKVVYLTSVSLGEYVNAYQTVAKIADITSLILYTSSNDAALLPIGAKVELEIDDAFYDGEVVANPSTLYNDPDENMQKAALINLTGDRPTDIKLGTDARIVYIQEQRDNALILPRTQINLLSGRRYVNVLEDGVRVEKDVEVGLMTETEVEIIKGLDEGDLVIIN